MSFVFAVFYIQEWLFLLYKKLGDINLKQLIRMKGRLCVSRPLRLNRKYI